MNSIQLPWKSFNLNLQLIDAWAKSQFSTYAGNSADYQLTLWFSEPVTEEVAEAVASYWNNLNTSSTEAIKYVTTTQIQETIATLKANAVIKPWDELSVAQRKLLLGQTPTLEELGL